MTKIIKNGKDKVFRARCRDCATDFSFEFEDVMEISAPVIPGMSPLPNMPKMRVVKCPVCQADVSVDLVTDEEWGKPSYYRGFAL